MAPCINGDTGLNFMRTAGVPGDDDFGATDGSKSSFRTLDVAVDLRDRRIDYRLSTIDYRLLHDRGRIRLAEH